MDIRELAGGRELAGDQKKKRMGWNCKYAGVGVWGVLVRFERYCKNSLCLNIGLTELPLTHVSMSDSTAVTISVGGLH